MQDHITRLKKDSENSSGLSFFLIDSSQRSVVFSKTYQQQAEIKAPDAQALCDAFNQCLENILTNLEKDLQQTMQYSADKN